MRTRPPGTCNNVPFRLECWKATITTLEELAAIATTSLLTPSIVAWVDATSGEANVWRLLPSAAETGESIQRPDDWNELSNAKVWFRAST